MAVQTVWDSSEVYHLQTALSAFFLLGDFSAGFCFGASLAQLLLHDDSTPVQILFPLVPPYSIYIKITNSGPRTYAHRAKSVCWRGSWAGTHPDLLQGGGGVTGTG